MSRLERVRRWRAQRATAGLKRVDLYVPEEKVDELRLFARSLIIDQVQSRLDGLPGGAQIDKDQLLLNLDDEESCLEVPPLRSREASL